MATLGTRQEPRAAGSAKPSFELMPSSPPISGEGMNDGHCLAASLWGQLVNAVYPAPGSLASRALLACIPRSARYDFPQFMLVLGQGAWCKYCTPVGPAQDRRASR